MPNEDAAWNAVTSDLLMLRCWHHESAAGRERAEAALSLMLGGGMVDFLGERGWFDLLALICQTHSIGGTA